MSIGPARAPSWDPGNLHKLEKSSACNVWSSVQLDFLLQTGKSHPGKSAWTDGVFDIGHRLMHPARLLARLLDCFHPASGILFCSLFICLLVCVCLTACLSVCLLASSACFLACLSTFLLTCLLVLACLFAVCILNRTFPVNPSGTRTRFAGHTSQKLSRSKGNQRCCILVHLCMPNNFVTRNQ